MSSVVSNKLGDSKESFEAYEELMENIKYIKDIVDDSEDVMDEMGDVYTEAALFTDVVNQKIQMLEYKAKKVGSVMNRMFTSIDEGNMLLDETMRDIKYNGVCKKDINCNLDSVWKELEKVGIK